MLKTYKNKYEGDIIQADKEIIIINDPAWGKIFFTPDGGISERLLNNCYKEFKQ